MIAIQKNSHPRQSRPRSISALTLVGVVYGPHSLQVEIAGLTVAETNLAFKDILNVSGDAEAYLNGQRAVGGDRLLPGDRLEFVKEWGRKGGGGDDDEFYSMTCKEVAALFGVKYSTVREWIITGKLRGTRKPLRTSLQACRELRDQLLVQPPPPVNTSKPLPFPRRDRQSWEFIDPSKSGTK